LAQYKGEVDESHYLLHEAVELFREKKILDGRKKVMEYLSFYPTQIENIYRWAYNNLDLWGSTQETKDAAVITIRNGLANLSLVGIPEISLSASLIELTGQQ
jgi:hypothetical protein